MSYRVTEPHPSVPSSAYMHSGRGGAGNTFRAPTTTQGSSAWGPPSAVALPVSSNKFTSGRGGAGNVHNASERAIFSFDEELERQQNREEHAAPVYHIGRGGAGNWATNEPTSRPHSPRKSSSSSINTDDSSRGRRSVEGVFQRISATFSRN
jgi:hypothetical protein